MHKRVIDGEEQGAPGPHGIPLSNLSRLLICQTQAGCLIGKCAPRRPPAVLPVTSRVCGRLVCTWGSRTLNGQAGAGPARS